MPSTALLLVLLAVCAILYCLEAIRSARPLIAHLRGPLPESFLLGNLRQLLRAPLPTTDASYLSTYGGLARIRAPLGEDRLWIADPAALAHILVRARDGWHKPHEARWALTVASGGGVNGAADGAEHARQRRAVARAFGAGAVRALRPGLRAHAEKLVECVERSVLGGGGGALEVDVPRVLGRGLLDAVGHALAGHNFRALEGGEDALAESLHDFMAKGFGRPGALEIFAHGIMAHVPLRVLNLLARAPAPRLRFLRAHVALANSVARRLIAERAEAAARGATPSADALSLIVKANAAEAGRWRLGDDELVPQLATLLAAGHETSTNTLSWILYELAMHEDIQSALRDELLRAGDNAALEELPLLNAVIDETLRYDPVVPHIFRVSTHDDAIPLSTPIRTARGALIDHVPVPAGTRVVLSCVAYSRLEALWGADADRWRPARWLDGTIKQDGAGVGPYQNLMTFGAGPRACIGWRLAVAELQVFLAALVRRFEFRAPARARNIRRENCLVMLPMVEGEEEVGNQLPLEVSVYAGK